MCNIRKQGGAALLDALIGMVLIGILASGLMLALTRASRLSAASSVRTLILAQASAAIDASGAALCGKTITLQLPNRRATSLTATCATANIGVNGVVVTQRWLTLSGQTQVLEESLTTRIVAPIGVLPPISAQGANSGEGGS
jgi:type II secretory pathway pseudopilin PulG